ncbi:hypothetical protein [Streptomyces sp. C8S0]|uniref:hypothetical protein n=1 Tax=Streptomyces sp. C8S0 TaxID=2585716 RepID=UPI00125D2D58|nr:hypothetical protein [Streptomyces sp. C8S0]
MGEVGVEGEGGLRAEVAFGDGGVDLVGVAGQGDGDVKAERGDQVGVVGVDGSEDGEFVGAGQVGEGLGGVGDLGRAGQRQPGSSVVWRRSTTTRARPGRSGTLSAIASVVRSVPSSI